MRKSKIDIVIDWNVFNTHEKRHISDYVTQKAEGYRLHEYRLILDGNPKIHVLYHADEPNPPEGYKRAYIPIRELQHDGLDRAISMILTNYVDVSPKEKQEILNDFIANGSILVIYKVKYAVFLFDEDEVRREEDWHQDENESEEDEKERLNGFCGYESLHQ